MKGYYIFIRSKVEYSNYLQPKKKSFFVLNLYKLRVQNNLYTNINCWYYRKEIFSS